MVAVTGFTQWLVPGGVFMQWALSAAVIAVGAYWLLGWPQLKAWELGRQGGEPPADSRVAWAVRQLSRGGVISFLVASLLEGPIGVAWYAGYTGHPHAKRLTWLSAWLLAAVWAAIYLRFGLAALAVVMSVFAGYAIVNGGRRVLRQAG